MNHIVLEEGRDITDGFAAVHDTLNNAPIDVTEYPANTWGHDTTILAFICFLLSFYIKYGLFTFLIYIFCCFICTLNSHILIVAF